MESIWASVNTADIHAAFNNTDNNTTNTNNNQQKPADQSSDTLIESSDIAVGSNLKQTSTAVVIPAGGGAPIVRYQYSQLGFEPNQGYLIKLHRMFPNNRLFQVVNVYDDIFI